MPELPDIVVYIEALRARIVGRELRRVRLRSPFLVRSVDPPVAAAEGRRVAAIERLGKRIVIVLEDDLFLVLHLMIAGRLHWRPPGAPVPTRVGLAAFDFDPGTLVWTEGGTQKRSALHLARGRAPLAAFDRGGVEVLEAPREACVAALRRESHTLKRALTDPRLFSGIGNAYSDEILHRARLSPLRPTRGLEDGEAERLCDAAREVLLEWTERLGRAAAGEFPEKVTAFRDGMAVHGRFGRPCPDCGAPVQRIVYAENECNYCPGCQTGGAILADRSLSRLLKDDWPRTLEALDEAARARRATMGGAPQAARPGTPGGAAPGKRPGTPGAGPGTQPGTSRGAAPGKRRRS
jgi:formamidopyrimidine-DNA glycosylase